MQNLTIDFLGKRYWAFGFSSLLVLISIVSLILNGLNLGLDFTGGILVEVTYPQAVQVGAVRDGLKGTAFEDATVQTVGSARSLLLRMGQRPDAKPEQLSQDVLATVDQLTGQKGELRRVEFVGPQAGDDLLQDGTLAILIAVIGILLYVYLRFEWRLALGSVIALVHDVVVVLGVFSLFRLEFDLTVLAAVLAVLGYSLNDTIVVFDRIRELFQRSRKGSAVIDVMNASVNQTLGRTIITSWTVVLVLVAMLIFGGPILKNFSLALLVGVAMGTYSSIYVASPLAMALGLNRADLLPMERTELDDRP